MAISTPLANRGMPVAERSRTRLGDLFRFLTTPGSDLRWSEVLGFTLVALLIVAAAYWNVVFGGHTLSLGAIWDGVLPFGPYGYGAARTVPRIVDPVGFYIREPWRLLAAQLWTQHHLPLWDPYLGGGAPLDPFSQSDAFFLPEMIFNALPYSWLDVYYLLRLVLCGVFAYIFLRSLKLTPVASAMGAVAYMLSGGLTYLVSTDVLDGFMLTPLLLWSIERLVTSRDHRLRWSIVVTVITWQLLLTGFPETIMLALLLAGSYYLVRALQERLRAAAHALASWRDAVRVTLAGLFPITLTYTLISLSAAALAAPLWLLFLQTLQSSGGEAVFINSSRVDGAPSLRYAFRLFLPVFYGPELSQWNVALPGGYDSQFYFGYSGTITIFLALVAVCAAGASLLLRRRSSLLVHTLFFAGVGALTLARIHNLPVSRFINVVPALRSIWFNHYAGGIWAICLAILAGIGADALLARRGWLRLVSVSVLLACIGALLVPNLHELQTAVHGMNAADQRHAIGIATTSLQVGGIILIGLLLVLALGAFIPRAAQAGLIALLVLELVAYAPRSLPLRYDAYTPPPYLAYVQRTDEPARTFGLDGVAFPPVEDGIHLQDVRSFNAAPPADYYQLVRLGFSGSSFFPGGWTGEEYALPPGALTQAQAAVQHRWVLDLFNDRYVLTYSTDLGQTTTLIATLDPPFDATTTPPLQPDASLAQTFTMPTANLSALLLSFTGRIAPRDTGAITLHVRLASAPSEDVRSVTLPFSEVRTTGTTRFAFDPLPDSAGQMYVIVLSVNQLSPATHLALWAVKALPGHPVSGLDQAGVPIPRMALSLAAETGTPHASDYRLVYNQDVRIYENPDALPRAFVAEQVETGVKDDDALTVLGSSGFPLAKTILLADTPPASQISAAFNPDNPSAATASTVHVSDYQVDSVSLQANMARPGFVALQDAYYPGWHADVDGAATPIYRSDIMFRAVFVPAGRHVIHFTYLPKSFTMGFLLVPLPPLLLLAWLALEFFWRRTGSALNAQAPGDAAQSNPQNNPSNAHSAPESSVLVAHAPGRIPRGNT